MILFLLLTTFALASDSPHGGKAASKMMGSENAKTPPGTSSYGKGITLKTKPMELKTALEKKSALAGKNILVRAEIATVCKMKGCWLTLKEGNQEVRVTFANYSFFVPKDAAKAEAVLQGKIFDKEISVEQAKHYAKDAGSSEAEIAKIDMPVKTPWFEATGLTITKGLN